MKQPCLYSAEVADGTRVKPFDVRPLFNDNALQKIKIMQTLFILKSLRFLLRFSKQRYGITGLAVNMYIFLTR